MAAARIGISPAHVCGVTQDVFDARQSLHDHPALGWPSVSKGFRFRFGPWTIDRHCGTPLAEPLLHQAQFGKHELKVLSPVLDLLVILNKLDAGRKEPNKSYA